MMEVKEKPDNVSDNPGITPYGTNVGAPSIKPDDISAWKQSSVHKVNKQFETRFKELKDEYEKLVSDFEWNDLVYRSEFSFEPVTGEEYYLYQRENGSFFLSLIEPSQWKMNFIGSFILDSKGKWTRENEKQK
jgi:hypothetical protein